MTALGYIGAAFVGLAVIVATLGLAARPKKVRIPEGIGTAEGGDTKFGAMGRLAEGALRGRKLTTTLSADLPRAGIAYSPAEFVAVATVASVIVGLLVGSAFHSPLFGFAAMIGTLIAARLFVRIRSNKWRHAFDAQLPEALDLLAGSLEAGSSLSQAMELVAAEGQPPLKDEFAQVLAETRLGVPLVEAMEASADRVSSHDYVWCVQAIRIQQEFGASLADVLRTLGEFMRWRQELKREVRALTAEGRISAYVLIGLPFAVAGFFWLTNPGYLGMLVTTAIGWLMLIGAGVLMVVGSIWMMRVVKVEV